MYMSESDFDGIFESFIAIFVGIGVAAGLIIGIPCGLAICLTSYCIYKCCKDSSKNEIITSNNDVEINIELENKISIDKLDLNEVTIVGNALAISGETFENVDIG